MKARKNRDDVRAEQRVILGYELHKTCVALYLDMGTDYLVKVLLAATTDCSHQEMGPRLPTYPTLLRRYLIWKVTQAENEKILAKTQLKPLNKHSRCTAQQYVGFLTKTTVGKPTDQVFCCWKIPG